MPVASARLRIAGLVLSSLFLGCAATLASARPGIIEDLVPLPGFALIMTLLFLLMVVCAISVEEGLTPNEGLRMTNKGPAKEENW